jgi:predicted dienelactone hydrolase
MERTMIDWMTTWTMRLAAVALCCSAGTAGASVGLTELPATADNGPVTVFYPSEAAPQTVHRGPFSFELAWQAEPQRGNGRLVVISHGSGGGPWVHANLAQALVQAGYVVAFPQHRGDNHMDHSTPGPASWKLRPGEVSKAIDAVAADPRFAPLLELDKVGMYGMSAGGHTALSLAGGAWSPALFKQHCDADLAEDFYACVGLAVHASEGGWGAFKRGIARWVIDLRFGDDTRYTHTDPRIAAIAAAVPFAADFDPATLAAPPVPLALLTAGHDHWLVPRFHSQRILAACKTCIHLADLPEAGHGAYLSPAPPSAVLGGLERELLDDPDGFDRRQLAEIDLRVVGFFDCQLRSRCASRTPDPTPRAPA